MTDDEANRLHTPRPYLPYPVPNEAVWLREKGAATSAKLHVRVALEASGSVKDLDILYGLSSIPRRSRLSMMGTKLRHQSLRTMAHVNDFPPNHDDTNLERESKGNLSPVSH
jgi:hypothetical protein